MFIPRPASKKGEDSEDDGVVVSSMIRLNFLDSF
jgi:hypothetical protein